MLESTLIQQIENLAEHIDKLEKREKELSAIIEIFQLQLNQLHNILGIRWVQH